MLQDQTFNILTDSGGDFVDTGPPFSGMVMQIRMNNTDLDTGVDVKLEMVNSGVVVADYDNASGSWTRVPRVLTFDTGGEEVADAPPIAAHDRLRLTVNQSEGVTGVKTARLNIVTGW